MNKMKLLFQGLFTGITLLAVLTLTGCGSMSSSNAFFLDTPKPHFNPPPNASSADVARFHVGQTVIVTFSGTPEPIPQHEEVIKENGTITLPLIGSIYAVGKTTGELQNEIYTNYVPKYYVRVNVTVSSGERVYYVGGEVRSPGTELYRDGTTLTKAIQSAGGLTDFASHKNVWLTHGGKRIKVNYDEALRDPSKDPAVYPDDQIEVKRSIW